MSEIVVGYGPLVSCLASGITVFGAIAAAILFCIDRKNSERRLQLRLIVNWIESFYNRRRLHSSVGYKTPVAVELISVAA